MEPEVVVFCILILCAAISKALFPRIKPRSVEGIIRVCVHTTRGDNLSDIVHRYISTSSNRYDVLFGILVECESLDDVVSFDSTDYPRDKIVVHYTVRMESSAHEKRLRKLCKKFVSGMEDMVVFAHARVVPEFGWDIHLIGAISDSVVTCPLCVHAAGFPTLRRRSNGDVVRNEARAFVHPGQVGTYVPSVCLCHEFVACHPLSVPHTRPEHVVVPTFPILSPTTQVVEEDVLDSNLHPLSPTLSNSDKLGITPTPTGLEMYHKYGSTSAARLAIKLDRKSDLGT